MMKGGRNKESRTKECKKWRGISHERRKRKRIRKMKTGERSDGMKEEKRRKGTKRVG